MKLMRGGHNDWPNFFSMMSIVCKSRFTGMRCFILDRS